MRETVLIIHEVPFEPRKGLERGGGGVFVSFAWLDSYAVHPRIPRMPGQSTLGFYQLGR